MNGSQIGVEQLFEEKAEALTGLLEVTKSLYECLRMREIAELGRVLEDRQKIMESIDELDIRIAEGISSPGRTGREPGADPAGEALGKARALLREIAELDRQCLREGKFLRDRIQDELFSMRRGSKAARQYTQHSALQPRFMDMRQ